MCCYVALELNDHGAKLVLPAPKVDLFKWMRVKQPSQCHHGICNHHGWDGCADEMSSKSSIQSEWEAGTLLCILHSFHDPFAPAPDRRSHTSLLPTSSQIRAAVICCQLCRSSVSDKRR